MGSKNIFLFGFLLIALFVTSKVAARELTATSEFTTYAHTDAKGVDDAKNAESTNGYGGEPGGYGSYPEPYPTQPYPTPPVNGVDAQDVAKKPQN